MISGDWRADTPRVATAQSHSSDTSHKVAQQLKVAKFKSQLATIDNR